MLRAVTAVVTALAVTLALGGEAGAVKHVPPNATNVRWWLGSWDTNFGKVFFQDIYRAKSDYPGPNDEVQYYWRAEGIWTMPKGKIVRFHGAIDPRDHLTYQGCYETFLKGNGTVCYPMLMYGNDASDRIGHGYWKPCFLPENCHSHHPWHGDRKSREWRAGFRFTQRGIPDGQTTIRTQTGGAGSLVWDSAPVASSRDRGKAVHGSMVFNIDEIPEATDLKVTVELHRGFFLRYSTEHTPGRSAVLEGLVTTSNDPHCTAGQYAAIRIFDRPKPDPDRIELQINGCRNEHWTSTDPDRVSVTLDNPKQVR